MVQSPFLLAGTLKLHLENLREILRSLYVDDIISGGSTTDEVQDLKKTIATVFGEAKFTMHKWNSNDPQLSVFKIRRRPSHPTVTFIYATPIFTLVNSQNK